MNSILQELIDVCNETNSKVISYEHHPILGDNYQTRKGKNK